MTISFPYNPLQVFYTDDCLFTEINIDDNYYVRVIMNLKAYPYQGEDTPFTYFLEYEFVPYQGKISVDFGKIIKPYFYIPSDLNEILDFSKLKEGVNTILLYRPISVDITFLKVNRSNNVIMSQRLYKNIRFIRGNQYGSLLSSDNKFHKSRITGKSLFSYNLYNATDPWILTKNGNYIQKLISTNDYLISYLVKDSSLKLGDTFSLNSNGKIKAKVITFPNGLQSVFFVWLDEHLALRIFEFTGRFIDKQTHNYITNTSVFKGKPIARTIEDIKGREITVNTGYIYKDDLRIINSILSSEKAWISFDLQKFISFIPITKEFQYTSEDQLFFGDIELSLNNYAEFHSDNLK